MIMVSVVPGSLHLVSFSDGGACASRLSGMHAVTLKVGRPGMSVCMPPAWALITVLPTSTAASDLYAVMARNVGGSDKG